MTWCEGRIVSEISITPHEPPMLSIPENLRPLARGVGLHHTTTKPEVIGRFLLLEVGELCTERQRAETERILRLQPFLADATVRAVEDSRGGVRIEVETIDEVPTVFGMQVRGMLPSALRFGNGNVRGQGLRLAANVERGSAYRLGVGLNGTAYQAFGRPYTLSFVAQRAPLGSTLSLALTRPFFTELQRAAWHVGFRDENQYLAFVPPEGDALSLGVARRLWDLGGVRRLGLGRQRAFVGVLLTAETVTPASSVVIVSDSGLVADTTGGLGGPFPAYHNRRLNAVVGLRAVSFSTVRGFDALAALQDVATGLQVSTAVGRGLSRSGDHDDVLVAAAVYAGSGAGTSFVGLLLQGEARWDRRTRSWNSMVGSGRLGWYFKPADSHVLVSSLELAAGARQRVPFQLMLGDPQGGVRGYAASRRSGARRIVLRLEERWYVGEVGRRAAVGVASFADAGRMSAGDAPFGTDSGVKVGVGAGLLLALPPQSPRLWRLDVAVPLSADPHAGWEVRLTSVWTRTFWREPDDVGRGRAGAAPSTIFGWP